jgi:hypothetical protein
MVDYLFGVETMQVSPLVIVALVGLVLICGGLVLVLALFVLRHTSHGALKFLELIAREGRDKEDNEDTPYVTAPRPNLRAIAEAQDFDTALTKHIIKDEIDPPRAHTYRPEATHLNNPPPAVPPLDQPFPDARPRLGARRSGESRPPPIYDRPDDEDDDALADFLDESP